MADRDKSAEVDKLLDERLRLIQIVYGSLLASVLAFTAFILFYNLRGQPPQAVAAGPYLSYAAIALFAGAFVAWAVVPKGLADKEVAKIAAGTWTAPSSSTPRSPAVTTDAEKLLAVYQTRSIIAGAILEAPAFMAGVAFMTERQAFALGIVAGAVLMMVATFPTRGHARVAGKPALPDRRTAAVRQCADGMKAGGFRGVARRHRPRIL